MLGSNTSTVMSKYNVRPHKRYGQNFLKDDNILRKIVEGSGVGENDIVLEIGPGLGSLTAKLADAAKYVMAVEIDDDLIPVLKDTLSGYDNIEIIHADILKTNVNELLKEHLGREIGVHVVANLPYYITTPVIMKLLEECSFLSSITVMVQNEVALRMQAGPGSKDYGALSLAVQYRAEASIIMKVSPSCFIPKPGVDSAVIRLNVFKKDENPHRVSDEAFLFSIIRAAFGQRRKMLTNSLVNGGLDGISKEMIEEELERLGLPKTVRGEALNLDEFISLSELLLMRKT